MFTIKAVSQATGVSIETLRAWERRYRVVEPRRDPNGRRSYDPADVIRLRKLREATERGHPISKLARVSDDELTGLLATGSDGPAAGEAPGFAAQMLAAASEYRPEECDQALSMALALLPLQRVVDEVMVPALLEVGERWHAGEFSIAQERIVSNAVKKQVSLVLDTYNRIAAGPPVVLATLSDERHELGILMCALLTAARGVRCLYLGPDLPPADVATFAERTGAAAVVLSFVRRETASGGEQALLAEFLRRLPRSIGVWIGGQGALAFEPAGLGERVVRLDDYRGLERELDRLTAATR
ncbi:MAG: MerR family transcriptional regulator [Proteobacteria bacterium]|nr:MerR family transcriptional regulator [Pseudomonadota bacterium]